jgi:glycerol-3-phosphate dehydrogenase
VTALWSLAERSSALRAAARDGVDLLVVGGGIAGAGVLRDAASRGLRALLVERTDFAAGTSSRSSKLVHGGLRYIGEGQLGVTREACRERDRLLRQNPNLVRSLPFLFPAWRNSAVPLWQVRAVLWVYAGLASFRRSSRFRMVRTEEVARFCPDLRREGLRGAGLYSDAQVDDARLVLEAVKSARALGGEAVNHAEVVGFERGEDGRLRAAEVRDALTGETLRIAARVIVNAAGPAVEAVRGLDRPLERPVLRPAKGVHLVIPRDRIPAQGAVTFEASDGRHLFLIPWDEVSILGTTDAFTDEIAEPVVTIEEVHYLLAAANEAFPGAALTTNDLRSVFAGVRPLAAAPDETKPASAVSREHHEFEDPSGLISVVGGKLTTFRAMGEAIVDRAVARLPRERRDRIGPSRTAEIPLRADDFDRAELEARLASRFGVEPQRAEYLVRAWGADAEALLAEAEPRLRSSIGRSRFTLAEIAWSWRHECPADLCDLLERRLRLAIFAVGQGIGEIDAIAQAAGDVAGWDAERRRAEARAYLDAVRRRYQIQIPRTQPARSAAA